MTSVKLTKRLRDEIVHTLLEQGGFFKAEDAKREAYVNACHAFYYKVFEPYLASFAFIHKGFFYHSDTFCICFDTNDINTDMHAYVRRGYKLLQVYAPEGYPTPFKTLTLEELGITQEDAHLQAVLTARKELSDEHFKREEAAEKARRLLDSVTTTTQLLKVWADIEPVLTKLLPHQPTTKYPISEPIADLNNLFGLTKEDK